MVVYVNFHLDDEDEPVWIDFANVNFVRKIWYHLSESDRVIVHNTDNADDESTYEYSYSDREFI